MLEKIGVWSHSDRVRLLAFFSTTPKEYWKGSQGLRDCEAEKGLIPGVGCVYVLEIRISSGVGIFSSPLIPPA